MLLEMKYIHQCSACNCNINYTKFHNYKVASKRLEEFGYLRCRSCSIKLNTPYISHIIKCDMCNEERYIKDRRSINRINKISKEVGYYYCRKCTSKKSPEQKAQLSLIIKECWQNKEYKDKIINAIKERWQNKEYKDSKIQQMSQTISHLWKNENSLYNSDGYKNKMAIVRANQPRISSIQEILYSVLDDLSVKYYREHKDKPNDCETVVGPYNFDCVIPRDGKPDLLIECQGDYWHSMDKAIIKDQQKHTYITKHFPNQYEIKYIWEHEFKCKDKIQELIKYWMGITEFELIDFDFGGIAIKKSEPKDYKLLLSKYHYLPNAGRGGVAYGAYFNDELIAVCVFSPIIRQNVNVDGYEQNAIRELSRLCIHPRYQKKNLASWFVSRCIKQLDVKYKCIISYCDTTFNHDGAVYKACNFTQDKIIKSDYWYVGEDGWVMHKKTLYEHAKRMNMKENEFATVNNYSKVFGKEKLRFVYRK